MVGILQGKGLIPHPLKPEARERGKPMARETPSLWVFRVLARESGDPDCSLASG